jgi:hypothetical protein
VWSINERVRRNRSRLGAISNADFARLQSYLQSDTTEAPPPLAIRE